MNETVQNLVQAIQAGDALETENTFANAMAEKLSAKLDDMRVGIAQSMFAEESLPGSHQAAMIAHNVASSTKQKVSSFGGQHFIHKPDDDSSSVMVHHKNNQFHVTHDDGQNNHTKSFDNAKDAHNYTHSLMSEDYYNISEEDYNNLSEEEKTEYELMEGDYGKNEPNTNVGKTPKTFHGAVKQYMRNKGNDTPRYDASRAQQATAKKRMVVAKKVIKKAGGDMNKVNQRANDYENKTNSY